MLRVSARTAWYVYEGAGSFLGLLAFTVTAVYFVTAVEGVSPAFWETPPVSRCP